MIWSYSPSSYLREIYLRQQAALYKFGIRRVGLVAAADEPVTLGEAQRHLEVDTFGTPAESDWDDWIEAHIPAAREYCEQYLGRALAPRTMQLSASGFPSAAVSTPPGVVFALPFGPVQSVTSITYLDQAAADAAYEAAYDAEFLLSGDTALAEAAGEAAAAAALQATVDPATYELDQYTGTISLAYGQTAWPTGVRSAPNSVVVEYVTGYVSAAQVTPAPFEYLPHMAKAAILVMLRHLFDRPGDESVQIPAQVTAMLNLVGGTERLDFA